MRSRPYYIFVIIILSCLFLSCEEEEKPTGPSDTSIKINIPTTRLDWGVIVYGQAIDKTYSFTCDISSRDRLRGSVTISGNGFYLVNGSGSYAIDPGAARTVKVRFLPDRKGSFTGTLTINHNGENKSSPLSIILTGSAN